MSFAMMMCSILIGIYYYWFISIFVKDMYNKIVSAKTSYGRAALEREFVKRKGRFPASQYVFVCTIKLIILVYLQAFDDLKKKYIQEI